MPRPRPAGKRPGRKKPQPIIPGTGNVTGGTVNFHSPVNIPGGHNITGSQFSARRININLGTPSQQSQSLRARNAAGQRRTGSPKPGAKKSSARAVASSGSKKKTSPKKVERKKEKKKRH